MAHATAMESIKKSRKPHVCDWCGQLIEPSQPYDRWRWFDGGDASTVRVHPECKTALYEWSAETGETEFMRGDNARGCNCNFDKDCERCAMRKLATPPDQPAEEER